MKVTSSTSTPEEMELTGFGSPAESRKHLGRVARLHGRIVLRDDASADLALTVGTVTAGHDAVDEDARVSFEVPCLARSPQHREPQVAAPEEGLNGAQSGRAISPDRSNEHDARGLEVILPNCGKARLVRRELIPVHFVGPDPTSCDGGRGARRSPPGGGPTEGMPGGYAPRHWVQPAAVASRCRSTLDHGTTNRSTTPTPR